MPRFLKLNDGKSLPALAWGNGTGGFTRSGDKATQGGAAALKAGILHIDTAQMYGTEKEAGAAIQAAGMKREDVWVTTKISRASNVKSTPEDIKRSVQESIEKIGFIPDMLLIHNPFVPDEGKTQVFWQGLEALVEDGTLKGCTLGVSNFRPQDLDAVLEVCKIKPAVNQLEYHPYILASLDPLAPYHQKHNIVIQSFGPLTPILRHPTGGPLRPVLEKIAQRLSNDTGKAVDSAGVLLLWTMQKNVCAVTTSANPENLKKMAAVLELPDLKQEEVEEIDQVGRKIHFKYYEEHMSKDYPEPNLPKDI